MTRGWQRALIALLIVADIALVAYVIRFRAASTPEQVIVVNADPGKDKPQKVRRGIVAPLELAGAPDGSVLRAMEGRCSGEPARVWLGLGSDGAMEEISIQGLQTVVSLESTEPGWSIIGTDAECAIHEWVSADNEATGWTQTTVDPERWYADPSSASVLHTPEGSSDLDERCEVVDVAQVRDQAYVLCLDGAVLRVEASPNVSFVSVGVVRGATALHVDGDGQVYALVRSAQCAAQLVVMSPDGVTSPPSCLGAGKLGMSVTVAGESLVVQVGHDLLQGRPGGDWVARAEG